MHLRTKTSFTIFYEIITQNKIEAKCITSNTAHIKITRKKYKWEENCSQRTITNNNQELKKQKNKKLKK